MIFDFHVHLSLPEHAHSWVKEWMSSNYTGDVDELINEILSPEGLRAYLQANNIDHAVGLAEVSPITTGWTGNEFVGELCAKANALPGPENGAKGRLLPFASINPFIVNDLPGELTRLADEFDFKGIKIYPPYHHHYANDTRMYPLYAKAQELGMPLMVHTGSSVFKGARIKYANPLLLDDVAIDFPSLPIVMAHSGRPFWYQQAFWMARQHPNVYMEISGLPGKKLMEYIPRLEEISHKVIYGSDWPGNPDMQRNVNSVREMPISDQAKQNIIYDNAAKIFGLIIK